MSPKKTTTQKTVNNFYAIIDTGAVRRINLTQDVSASIKEVFVSAGVRLTNSELDEVKFDGNYVIDEGEILYVKMDLNAAVLEVLSNGIGIPVLKLKTETIKTLFWVEDKIFYFQNFDSRKLLINRNIIVYNNQTYDALKEDAFIVDNAVHAIYADGKFKFLSYANANKIFSLSEFYVEATNRDLTKFSTHDNISIIDQQWFLDHSNSVIRKQVTLLQKSKILDGANTKTIKKDAKEFNLMIELDKNKKIIFPKDIKHCKEVLVFLNEQFYVGLITGTKYRTNSKRTI
ncbi:hypothetical protein [Ohtaekwangia koreensis]|uniref:DUF4868 domain-containing protein n=1 Tax=Ohtaekwangia koreensis TaxID=688867 RepID=A0A1T5J3B1_9BACT|nr:hypothetical protein [Ohtaekwangia koreensis]SKC45856.1 hypothetical protein SAMN05660236_0710 [Ohtaekwangia koreensis]